MNTIHEFSKHELIALMMKEQLQKILNRQVISEIRQKRKNSPANRLFFWNTFVWILQNIKGLEINSKKYVIVLPSQQDF